MKEEGSGGQGGGEGRSKEKMPGVETGGGVGTELGLNVSGGK